MVSASFVNRRPAGTPSGGQFAPAGRAETASTLAGQPAPAAAAMTDDERSLLEWSDTHPNLLRVAPEVNGRGRYLLPDPDTGEARSWVRVTTLAGTLDDTSNLSRWSQRMVVAGMQRDAALRERILGFDEPNGERRRELNRMLEEAETAGGSRLSAELGSALHLATEHADLGSPAVADLPGAYQPDVAAYRAALADAGIFVPGEWVERTGVNTAVGAAGTLDRIGVLDDGTLAIVDVKTGRSLDFGGLEYGAQLACYAHMRHLWGDGGYEEMPPVRSDFAVIAHVPVGAGTCRLFKVDITAGWEAAQQAVKVREIRSRSRKWIVPFANA